VALASSLLPALLQARARGEAVYGERLQRYFDLSAALAYAFSLPLALAAPWLVRLAYGAAFCAGRRRTRRAHLGGGFRLSGSCGADSSWSTRG